MANKPCRLIAAAVAASCALTAFAESPREFPTVDAAAVEALRPLLSGGGCREVAGLILQHGDVYTVTEPVAGRDDTFKIHVKLTAGDKLAGIYHTHPRCNADKLSALFSPPDVAQAQALRVPSYIGVKTDGTIRRFDPNHDATESYTMSGASRPIGLVARGNILTEG